MSEPEDFVVCRICGKSFRRIDNVHLGREHNLTTSQYKELYPNALTMCLSTKKILSNAISKGQTKESIRRRVNTRRKRYGDDWVRDRESMHCNMSNARKNGGQKKGMITRRRLYGPSGFKDLEIARQKNSAGHLRIGPDGLTVAQRTHKHRKELYGTTGVRDPEAFRKNNSEGQKRLWRDYSLEERENRLRGGAFKALTQSSRHPNTSETRLIPILGSVGFQYVGSLTVLVGGHNPDFIRSSDSLIIEYDGWAGHNPGSRFTPDTWEQCLANDDKRDADYRSAGYDVLRILPEHLNKGEDFIHNMVGSWVVQSTQETIGDE